MRPEALYLADIVQAGDAIHRFLERISEADFLQDEIYQSAMLQKLTVIGEAASRLPADFLVRHPEIEWADIIGFRNIAVHEYFAVDWQIVWNTATTDVSSLRERIANILLNEFPGLSLEQGG